MIHLGNTSGRMLKSDLKLHQSVSVPKYTHQVALKCRWLTDLSAHIFKLLGIEFKNILNKLNVVSNSSGTVFSLVLFLVSFIIYLNCTGLFLSDS